jgi:hypothetical protein
MKKTLLALVMATGLMTAGCSGMNNQQQGALSGGAIGAGAGAALGWITGANPWVLGGLGAAAGAVTGAVTNK